VYCDNDVCANVTNGAIAVKVQTRNLAN